MEKDRFDSNFINLEQEKRANELIDGLVVEFDESYKDVYAGIKNKAVLYSGDYIYGTPKELILESRPELLTVDYVKLTRLFELIFKDDVIGELYTQRLKKYPESKTLFLTEFVKTNKQGEYGQLEVVQAYVNLKPTLDGSDMVMVVDQYLMPDAHIDIPASEIWTLKRFDNGEQKNTNLLTFKSNS